MGGGEGRKGGEGVGEGICSADICSDTAQDDHLQNAGAACPQCDSIQHTLYIHSPCMSLHSCSLYRNH